MRIVILLLFIFVLFVCSSAYAGHAFNYSLNYNHSESFMDGEKISSYSNLNQAYTLGFYRLLTPAFFFNFGLFVGLNDSKSETEFVKAETFERFVYPSFDFRLQNPRYELAWGLSLQESWNTKDLSNEGRLSGNTIYARLNTQAWKSIPSFLFQFSRSHHYDHLDPKQEDSTATSYSGRTGYGFGWKDFQASISGSYSHSEAQTDLEYRSKTVSDSYGINYISRYQHSWENRVFLTASYIGGYQWEKDTSYLTQFGQIAHERTAAEGLHAVGTVLDPDPDVLTSEPGLIDNDKVSLASVNIGSQPYHNIGLRLNSPNQTVDRLFIYVTADVTLDTNLSIPSNWVAYSSNSNLTGTIWTVLAIQTVNIVEVDVIKHIFRYEIVFSSPRTDLFYKVINLRTVNIPGVTNVYVTEVEAILAENAQGTGKYSSDASSFSQSFNLGTSAVFKKVRLNLGYDVQRMEGDPDSVPGAFGRFINSFVGKNLNAGTNASVMRTYGPSISWTIIPQLAASASYNRNEMFDDSGTMDTYSNFYSMGLSSVPFPTLNLNLSVSRAETSISGKKISTGDSILLSTGVQLYPNIHISTDGRVYWVKDEATGLTTDSKYLNGNIDAKVTKNIFANFNYGFVWRDMGVLENTVKTGGFVVSYSGLRYFVISGGTQMTESDDTTTTAGNIGASWLMFPVVRVTLGYSYFATDPGTTTHSVSAYSMMTFSKHLNLRISTSYSRDSLGAESNYVGVNLSGIF